jgi:hypothetical protein
MSRKLNGWDRMKSKEEPDAELYRLERGRLPGALRWPRRGRAGRDGQEHGA